MAASLLAQATEIYILLKEANILQPQWKLNCSGQYSRII